MELNISIKLDAIEFAPSPTAELRDILIKLAVKLYNEDNELDLDYFSLPIMNSKNVKVGFATLNHVDGEDD